MTRRFENWPEILADEIKAAKKRPFSWGSHDCASFAARVVEAMTGKDFTFLFNGYNSAEVAAEVIAQNGGLEAMVTRCLGVPIPPLCAQRGDVCMIDTPEGPALGICDGAWIWCAGLTGLNRRPLSSAIKAWRVA